MERVERDAYRGVLRAFAAGGAITWARESVLSDLRAELSISEDVHRQFLKEVIAEGGVGGAAGGKRGGSKGVGPGAASGRGSGKRARMDKAPKAEKKAAKLPSAAMPNLPGPAGRKGTAGGFADRLAHLPQTNPLVGKTIRMFLEDEENPGGEWYEALVSDYKPESDEHAIVYVNEKTGTPDEEWEMIKLADLKEGVDYKVEGVQADWRKHILGGAAAGAPPAPAPKAAAPAPKAAAPAPKAAAAVPEADKIQAERERIMAELAALGSDSSDDSDSSSDSD